MRKQYLSTTHPNIEEVQDENGRTLGFIIKGAPGKEYGTIEEAIAALNPQPRRGRGR